MASTRLKKVGTRPCLPLCGIPSSFYNSLQMSGDWGDKLLKFRNRNVVPFLSNTGFYLLNCLRSSLSHLPLYDAPNVFYGWKIWTAGWPFQYPDPSSTQPWYCNWCSMWSGIVMLENATRTHATPYHQRCRLLNWVLITTWVVLVLFSPDEMASQFSQKNFKFWFVWP